jgi:hypothetical protein
MPLISAKCKEQTEAHDIPVERWMSIVSRECLTSERLTESQSGKSKIGPVRGRASRYSLLRDSHNFGELRDSAAHRNRKLYWRAVIAVWTTGDVRVKTLARMIVVLSCSSLVDTIAKLSIMSSTLPL